MSGWLVHFGVVLFAVLFVGVFFFVLELVAYGKRKRDRVAFSRRVVEVLHKVYGDTYLNPNQTWNGPFGQPAVLRTDVFGVDFPYILDTRTGAPNLNRNQVCVRVVHAIGGGLCATKDRRELKRVAKECQDKSKYYIILTNGAVADDDDVMLWLYKAMPKINFQILTIVGSTSSCAGSVLRMVIHRAGNQTWRPDPQTPSQAVRTLERTQRAVRAVRATPPQEAPQASTQRVTSQPIQPEAASSSYWDVIVEDGDS